ncbi:SRPBCC domain-containing protein [Nitratireductor sp. ZSWI3]|uniref:SRPBCC family protein n=1 Tax=Nitratireductor sp. ZSWI3 TaxID=2966359 RepID=UPI00214F6467|nr:SRPBCC domain-containing protein [Nitratireductor sp. ZSWI3]MCR4265721.1 SRPBCC domain-containing protein [Nitratireductor sp. ZSWI3]
MNARTAAKADAELHINRTFDAPRALVFETWTKQEHLDRWSCPAGFTMPHSEGDIRTGGWFRTCMRSPDGQDHWLSGRYREVVPPERIVFTHAWHDENGEPGHETVVEVTFTETPDGRTRMSFHQAFFASKASRDGHEAGWTESFDKLDALLAALA